MWNLKQALNILSLQINREKTEKKKPKWKNWCHQFVKGSESI